MSITYTDLKKGTAFIMDGDPYEVVDASFSRMQQRKAVMQARLKNLRTGKLIDRTFQASDSFELADVEKRPLMFLYGHRGEFVFTDPKDPAQKGETRPQSGRRFSLNEEQIGDNAKWLKPNTEVTALFFDEKLMNLTIPVKMDFKITEAAPGVQGDRAQSGTKAATLETGTIIQVPLFINPGDTIRVNTATGEYAERVEKA